VTYYTESAQNFFEQYSESQQDVLMLEGPDRYQAEIDGLNGRPAKKRPHRHLSAAERRSAKIEEVLERVFGSSRTEPSPEPEPSHELKPNVEPGETFEAYQARLDGYAAVRRDAEIGREKTRRRGGRCGPTAD